MSDLSEIINEINYLRAKLGLPNRSKGAADSKSLCRKECDVYQKLVDVRNYWKELIETPEGKKEALFALQFFTLIPLPLWTADCTGKIRHWNEWAEKAYSLKSEDVIGEDFIPLFVNEAEKAQARQDLADIINGKEGLVHFNMADDIDSRGNIVRVLTCCFAVYDERLSEVTQAEISFDINQLAQHQAELDKIQARHREREHRRAHFLEKERDYLLKTLQSYHGKYLESIGEKIGMCSDMIDNPNTPSATRALQETQLNEHTEKKDEFNKWYLQVKQKIEDCETNEEMHSIRSSIDQKKEYNV